MRGPAGLADILWREIEGSSDLSDVFVGLVALPADICADATLRQAHARSHEDRGAVIVGPPLSGDVVLPEHALRLQLLTRRDAGHALKVAMTIPALAGPSPGRDAEPLKVPK